MGTGSSSTKGDEGKRPAEGRPSTTTAAGNAATYTAGIVAPRRAREPPTSARVSLQPHEQVGTITTSEAADGAGPCAVGAWPLVACAACAAWAPAPTSEVGAWACPRTPSAEADCGSRETLRAAWEDVSWAPWLAGLAAAADRWATSRTRSSVGRSQSTNAAVA